MKFTKSLLALSLLSFSTEAFATDYTWTHLGGDQNWETNGNWNPNNAYPNSFTDAAIFPPDLVGYSVFIGNSKTINSISFDFIKIECANVVNRFFRLRAIPKVGEKGYFYSPLKIIFYSYHHSNLQGLT